MPVTYIPSPPNQQDQILQALQSLGESFGNISEYAARRRQEERLLKAQALEEQKIELERRKIQAEFDAQAALRSGALDVAGFKARGAGGGAGAIADVLTPSAQITQQTTVPQTLQILAEEGLVDPQALQSAGLEAMLAASAPKEYLKAATTSAFREPARPIHIGEVIPPGGTGPREILVDPQTGEFRDVGASYIRPVQEGRASAAERRDEELAEINLKLMTLPIDHPDRPGLVARKAAMLRMKPETLTAAEQVAFAEEGRKTDRLYRIVTTSVPRDEPTRLRHAQTTVRDFLKSVQGGQAITPELAPIYDLLVDVAHLSKDEMFSRLTGGGAALTPMEKTSFYGFLPDMNDSLDVILFKSGKMLEYTLLDQARTGYVSTTTGYGVRESAFRQAARQFSLDRIGTEMADAFWAKSREAQTAGSDPASSMDIAAEALASTYDLDPSYIKWLVHRRATPVK